MFTNKTEIRNYLIIILANFALGAVTGALWLYLRETLHYSWFMCYIIINVIGAIAGCIEYWWGHKNIQMIKVN